MYRARDFPGHRQWFLFWSIGWFWRLPNSLWRFVTWNEWDQRWRADQTIIIQLPPLQYWVDRLSKSDCCNLFCSAALPWRVLLGLRLTGQCDPRLVMRWTENQSDLHRMDVFAGDCRGEQQSREFSVQACKPKWYGGGTHDWLDQERWSQNQVAFTDSEVGSWHVLLASWKLGLRISSMASEEFGFLNLESWLQSNLYLEASIQAPPCNYVLYKVILTSSFLSIRVPNQKKQKKIAVDENLSAFLLGNCCLCQILSSLSPFFRFPDGTEQPAKSFTPKQTCFFLLFFFSLLSIPSGV